MYLTVCQRETSGPDSLREAVASSFAVPEGREFWLICPGARQRVLTLGPQECMGCAVTIDGQAPPAGGKLLRRDCGVSSGDRLYFEYIAVEGEGLVRSRAAVHFERIAYEVCCRLVSHPTPR